VSKRSNFAAIIKLSPFSAARLARGIDVGREWIKACATIRRTKRSLSRNQQNPAKHFTTLLTVSDIGAFAGLGVDLLDPVMDHCRAWIELLG